jgi:hypothetical protein
VKKAINPITIVRRRTRAASLWVAMCDISIAADIWDMMAFLF